MTTGLLIGRPFLCRRPIRRPENAIDAHKNTFQAEILRIFLYPLEFYE